MKYVFVINRFTVKKDLNKVINNIKEYSVKNKLNYIIEVKPKLLILKL